MEALINFETAKLAKEKGIELLHTHFYVLEFSTFKANKTPQRNSLPNDNSENFLQIVKNRKGQPHIAPAYTQSVLQKHIREEKGISVDVYTALKEKNIFQYGCDMMALFNISDEWQTYNMNKFFDTYEKALEAGLHKALQFINP